jgi:hypothetical protein
MGVNTRLIKMRNRTQLKGLGVVTTSLQLLTQYTHMTIVMSVTTKSDAASSSNGPIS